MDQLRRSAFRIVIRKIERPFTDETEDQFNWICQTLGFFEEIDKEKTASTIFKEIVKATEKGEALTSTAISQRIDMSRGAVINHLNNLIRAGLITRHGRYYISRSKSMYRTIKEIEEDILRIFKKMEASAKDIDREIGILKE